jgi:hypothetical protein
MSSISIAGDTSGSIILQAPSVSGSTTLTLPATSGTVITTATGQTLTAPSVSGTLTMTTGGITFNANPGGGTQSTLNDFEHGTWTPKAGNGTSAMTTTYLATYTKIGKMVAIYLDVILPNPNPTNNNYITNLPFAGGVNGAGNGGGGVAYTDFQGTLGFHVTSNTTDLYGFNNATNSTANISGKRVIISFVYLSGT